MSKKSARDAEETWPIRHVSDLSELNKWDYLAGNIPPLHSPEHQEYLNTVKSAEENGLESFIGQSEDDESGKYVEERPRGILFVIFAFLYAPVFLFVTKKGWDGKRRIVLNKVLSWILLAIWTFILLTLFLALAEELIWFIRRRYGAL